MVQKTGRSRRAAIDQNKLPIFHSPKQQQKTDLQLLVPTTQTDRFPPTKNSTLGRHVSVSTFLAFCEAVLRALGCALERAAAERALVGLEGERKRACWSAWTIRKGFRCFGETVWKRIPSFTHYIVYSGCLENDPLVLVFLGFPGLNRNINPGP